MLKLGVTGGIGSGKTIICSIFSALGVPIFYADEKAKILTETCEELKKAIIDEFGKESFNKSGYNRQYMASLVFRDQKSLLKLNQLIHPVVEKEFLHWFSLQNYHYVIFEAAILFESGADKMMDYSVMVDAPLQLRIDRIMKRDECKREEVEFRMQNQWSAETIRRMADWVVTNDDKTLILPQILKLHKHLIKKNTSHG